MSNLKFEIDESEVVITDQSGLVNLSLAICEFNIGKNRLEIFMGDDSIYADKESIEKIIAELQRLSKQL